MQKLCEWPVAKSKIDAERERGERSKSSIVIARSVMCEASTIHR